MSAHAAFVPRYKHLRKVGLELNTRLASMLSKEEINEGGKKLGILKKNTLVLDTEDEIAVLMDYCLHDVRRQGKTAIERFLEESPPPPESDEMVILQALRHARYALFMIESLEPGVGVQIRDLLRNESLFLMDTGMSRSAEVGMLMIGRLVTLEGFTETSGAALPAGIPRTPAERDRILHSLTALLKGKDVTLYSPEQASELTAGLIRSCLQRGAAERIKYADAGKDDRPGMLLADAPPRPKVGRNSPCPCGSGKKFKQCCGRL